ncbi:hypothetical protein A0H81_09012 [Grifola frondosa]|uniref:Uncharacterized protein n=1 Tax=Grifola frondosa TaxID=5627 RepID=A0A1C7M234_GRIFR|nr:hypothetical protein A0H81_09012 [Grifola frondosa]
MSPKDQEISNAQSEMFIRSLNELLSKISKPLGPAPKRPDPLEEEHLMLVSLREALIEKLKGQGSVIC